MNILPGVLVIAKIGASIILVAATLGLLWHEPQTMGHWGGWGKAGPIVDVPSWLNPGLSGWYPTNLNLGYRIFVGSTISGLAYLASGILCVAAIFATPFIRLNFVRFLLGIPLLSAIAYELVLFDAAGELPNESMTVTMLTNIRFGLDGTVWTYSREISRNMLFVGAMAIPYLWQPPTPRSAWRDAVMLAIVSGATASVLIIIARTAGATRQFPSPVSTFIYTATYLSSDGERVLKDVVYERQPAGQFDKIVLVMDESVRADYLSLNDEDVRTTPYLASVPSKIVNFGSATSAANCSVETRLAIRYMLREIDLGRPWPDLLSNATIWQYARRAGYKTVYIDSFGGPLTLTSGMTATERSHIDERISSVGTPYHARDVRNSALLRDLLSRRERLFVVVDKYGTHVPYTNAYPAEANSFDADLTKSFNLDEQEEVRRHYKNAIHWSIDGFFRALGSQLPPRTLLIYTADHGQTLSTAGRMSHCSPPSRIQASEFLVPLFAMTTEAEWEQALRASASKRQNKASHLQIAPTLLLALGYDADYVSEKFDTPPLTVPAVPKPRRLLYGGQAIVFD